MDVLTLLAELRQVNGELRHAKADHAAACEEIVRLREVVRYWSYCTYHGMRRECPEKESELIDVCRALNIPPYSGTEPA